MKKNKIPSTLELHTVERLTLAYLNELRTVHVPRWECKTAGPGPDEFAVMASGNGGPFHCQLGNCRLNFPAWFPGAVSIQLVRDKNSLIGNGAVVWHPTCVKAALDDLGPARGPKSHLALFRKTAPECFPWMAVNLSDEYLGVAKPGEIKLALAAFAAAAFGIMKYLSVCGIPANRRLVAVPGCPNRQVSDQIAVTLKEIPVRLAHPKKQSTSADRPVGRNKVPVKTTVNLEPGGILRATFTTKTREWRYEGKVAALAQAVESGAAAELEFQKLRVKYMRPMPAILVNDGRGVPYPFLKWFDRSWELQTGDERRIATALINAAWREEIPGELTSAAASKTSKNAGIKHLLADVDRRMTCESEMTEMPTGTMDVLGAGSKQQQKNKRKSKIKHETPKDESKPYWNQGMGGPELQHLHRLPARLPLLLCQSDAQSA